MLERPRQDNARAPHERHVAMLAELESYLPHPPRIGTDHFGFAVPLRLRSSFGELSLITAIMDADTGLRRAARPDT